MEDRKACPPLGGVLETALYVDDLECAGRFYETVFGLPLLVGDARLRAYDVAGRQVLLLFKRGASTEPVRLPGGTIPPHDGAGTAHFAFSIRTEELEPWRAWLTAQGVAITGEIQWPRGGTSLYFADPDGNVGELATPGVWATY